MFFARLWKVSQQSLSKRVRSNVILYDVSSFHSRQVGSRNGRKKRDAHTARHSYATFHFSNKYEADAPADTNRTEFLDSLSFLLVPQASSARFFTCIRESSSSRFGISWKVKSYDRYVLEIKSTSIFRFAHSFFFIYTYGKKEEAKGNALV